MKTLTTFIFTVAAALALTLTALAQPPGARTLATGVGGTDNIGVSSTNAYHANCEEYDSFSLMVGLKATVASTSTIQLIGYRSLDSTTYETGPFYSEIIAMNNTNTVNSIRRLDVGGAAVVRLYVGNTNAVVACTNFSAVILYKAPKLAISPTDF